MKAQSSGDKRLFWGLFPAEALRYRYLSLIV